MRPRTFLLPPLGLALCTLAAACASSSAPPSASALDASFVGDWICSYTGEFTSANPAESGPRSLAFTDHIATGSGPNVVVVSSQDLDGGDVCSLNFTVSGRTATLAGTQVCEVAPGLLGTYESGTLTLTDGNHWTASVTTAIDGEEAMSIPIDGTLVFTATCARM
jgi:hypothetical protein